MGIMRNMRRLAKRVAGKPIIAPRPIVTIYLDGDSVSLASEKGVKLFLLRRVLLEANELIRAKCVALEVGKIFELGIKPQTTTPTKESPDEAPTPSPEPESSQSPEDPASRNGPRETDNGENPPLHGREGVGPTDQTQH